MSDNEQKRLTSHGYLEKINKSRIFRKVILAYRRKGKITSMKKDIGTLNDTKCSKEKRKARFYHTNVLCGFFSKANE